MPLDSYYRRKINVVLFTGLIGGLIGTSYAASLGGTLIYRFASGVCISMLVISFEQFYVQQPVGAWLRNLPTLWFLLISTLVWVLLISLCLQTIPILFGETEAYPEEYQASIFGQDFAFALLASFVINSLLRIRRLVGSRILSNFLMGRYHRPMREGKIFMFLDLADSTQLAEQLGDIQVQSMIKDFFFGIARPIARCGGETHRYIGDEIVVTWPLSGVAQNNRCIECVFAIQSYIETNASTYKHKFGVVPRLRIGLHGGSVVASEVGDDKREIVYFGDTVNTAARIQGLCKTLGKPVLISAELIEHLEPGKLFRTRFLGDFELKGKQLNVGIHEVSRYINDHSAE